MTPPDGWTAEALIMFVRAVVVDDPFAEPAQLLGHPAVRALFPETPPACPICRKPWADCECGDLDYGDPLANAEPETPPADAPDLERQLEDARAEIRRKFDVIEKQRAENARLRAEVARLTEASRRAYHAGHRAGAINGPLTEEEVGRLFSSAFGGAS